MFTFLAIVHIAASVIMVIFILLQDPKGGGGALGMLGGGGSKSLFGSTGGNQFLVNVTKWMAVIFAFTSIYLAALSSQKEGSVMDQYTQDAATESTEKPTETDKVDSTQKEPDNKGAVTNEEDPISNKKKDIKDTDKSKLIDQPDSSHTPSEKNSVESNPVSDPETNIKKSDSDKNTN